MFSDIISHFSFLLGEGGGAIFSDTFSIFSLVLMSGSLYWYTLAATSLMIVFLFFPSNSFLVSEVF